MKNQAKNISLLDAILFCKDREMLGAFLRDLCTPQEISALSERWRVCQLLEQGDLSYRDIHAKTGASLTTISRVARFLKSEPHKGYRSVLSLIQNGGKKER